MNPLGGYLPTHSVKLSNPFKCLSRVMRKTGLPRIVKEAVRHRSFDLPKEPIMFRNVDRLTRLIENEIPCRDYSPTDGVAVLFPKKRRNHLFHLSQDSFEGCLLSVFKGSQSEVRADNLADFLCTSGDDLRF